MMYPGSSGGGARYGASQYSAVRSHGQVSDASPTRLVQIVLEHVLSSLATAQGCMGRIRGNLPLNEVVQKCNAMSKAMRLIGHLNATLDMERGGEIAANLRNLYLYMLGRLTLANANNDAAVVMECSNLIRTVKAGWDQIVREDR